MESHGRRRNPIVPTALIRVELRGGGRSHAQWWILLEDSRHRGEGGSTRRTRLVDSVGIEVLIWHGTVAILILWVETPDAIQET